MQSRILEADFSVSGRVALVTGAGRGIGRAIAMALASGGACVAVQDIELPVAEAVVAEMAALGCRGVAIGGDCTDPAFAEAVHSSAVAALGSVDILVNNAAVQESVTWTEVRVERLEWQYRGNVVTPLLLTRLCVPAMKAKRWGRVVNLSSIQGTSGFASMLAYGMTKASVEHMTRTLARDLGPAGITVNAIAPGYFDTHRNRDQFKSVEEKLSRGEGVPTKRVGDPADIVGTAMLLCSAAGEYITGQVISVDGGLSIR